MAETSVAVLTVVFDAHDPFSPARFWSGLLGREVVDDAGSALLPGSRTQVGLRFVPNRATEAGPGRPLHLHLSSESREDQGETVERALHLGGRHLDVGQRPEEGHVVLADPEGNALCVIEPHNAYLAGCGPLAEVACDGTREVGLFWSAALGWPLVWDQDGETAVQSPGGGTKVAWGGPPVAAKQGPNRQRFELTLPAADLSAQVERWVALGAARLGATSPEGAVLLGDPDGNEFVLRPDSHPSP